MDRSQPLRSHRARENRIPFINDQNGQVYRDRRLTGGVHELGADAGWKDDGGRACAPLVG